MRSIPIRPDEVMGGLGVYLEAKLFFLKKNLNCDSFGPRSPTQLFDLGKSAGDG
jgi:hypothetical protein